MKDKTFVRDVADRFGCDDRRAETLIFAVFRNCATVSRPQRRQMWPLNCLPR